MPREITLDDHPKCVRVFEHTNESPEELANIGAELISYPEHSGVVILRDANNLEETTKTVIKNYGKTCSASHLVMPPAEKDLFTGNALNANKIGPAFREMFNFASLFGAGMFHIRTSLATERSFHVDIDALIGKEFRERGINNIPPSKLKTQLEGQVFITMGTNFGGTLLVDAEEGSLVPAKDFTLENGLISEERFKRTMAAWKWKKHDIDPKDMWLPPNGAYTIMKSATWRSPPIVHSRDIVEGPITEDTEPRVIGIAAIYSPAF